jgi:ADP-ribose pyrophosphatase YjhB (NUDIX family)
MNWKYCPFCGGSLQQSKDFSVCAGCGKHHYVNPKSTVGILLFDSNNRLVLAIRKEEPFKNFMDMIGGFVAIGESLEDGAKRETSEETGLTIGVDTSELEYIGSTYVEVEFMGYTTPVNSAVYCAVMYNEVLTANDDVAGFVRVDESDFQPEKQAWSKEVSPLVKKGFEWLRKRKNED